MSTDKKEKVHFCSGKFTCPRCQYKEKILFLRKGVPFLCSNCGQVTTTIDLLKNGRIKDYEENTCDMSDVN